MTRTAWVLAGWLVLSTSVEAQSRYDQSHPWRPVDGQSLAATGYTLPQGSVELGLMFAGYGVTEWLTVGLQPVYWVVAPILGGVSANASVKLGLPLGSLFNASLEINPVWFRVEIDNNNVRGILLPITLGTSFHPSHRQHYSLAVRYSSAEGLNDSEVRSQEVAGAALTRLVQLIGQTQFQLTRAFSIYVQGVLQMWEQEIRVEGSSQLDDRTRVEVEGVASSVDQAVPWAALAGIHLRFSAVNLRLGAGYGNIFVPRLGLTTRRYEGVVPDLDFFVRF